MANGIDKFNRERQADKLATAKYLYNGVNYVSMYAACEAAGVQYARVRRRMSHNKPGAEVWTLQQAIDAPSYERMPLSPAQSALQDINRMIQFTVRDDEHLTMVTIGHIVARYLRENPRVQNQP